MKDNTQDTNFKETFTLDVPTPCIMVITVKGGDRHVIECPKGGHFSLEKPPKEESKKKS